MVLKFKHLATVCTSGDWKWGGEPNLVGAGRGAQARAGGEADVSHPGPRASSDSYNYLTHL